MINLKDNTLAAIVADDARAALVFNNKGIDFVIYADETLAVTCQKNNLAIDEIIAELTVKLNNHVTKEVNEWPLDKLADYIVAKHHAYIADKSPIILDYLQQLISLQERPQPMLRELAELFQLCASSLAMHTRKEEMILFPFIKQLVCAKEQQLAVPRPPFGSVNNPIHMMMYEHEDEMERIQKMVNFTDNFAIPKDADEVYATTMTMLQEFEEDLYTHIYLENSVLFPKAALLEQELSA